MKGFVAKFGGTCSHGCGEPIERGDWIETTSGTRATRRQYGHVDCPSERPTASWPRGVSTTAGWPIGDGNTDAQEYSKTYEAAYEQRGFGGWEPGEGR